MKNNDINKNFEKIQIVENKSISQKYKEKKVKFSEENSIDYINRRVSSALGGQVWTQRSSTQYRRPQRQPPPAGKTPGPQRRAHGSMEFMQLL